MRPVLLPAGLPAPARGGFTTRAGGVSVAPYGGLDLALHVGDDPVLVAHNRGLLATELGVAAGRLVHAEQVHGAGVATVAGPGRGPDVDPLPGVDALVTATPGLALVVLAADCLPVLLADVDAGVVGAVHAGRQGLAAGVLQQALAAMTALGAVPGRTSVVLGPAVCGRCYEVPVELAEQVEQQVPGSRASTRQGTASIDLAAGAEAVLRAAGVAAVTRVGGCTLERADFYSYRRDGRTGRHAGVIVLG